MSSCGWLLGFLLAVASGCSQGDTSTEPTIPLDAELHDAASEAEAADAHPSTDAGSDTPADVAADAVSDSSSDAQLDVSTDVQFDVSAEAEGDSSPADAASEPDLPCPSDFGFDQAVTSWTVTEGDTSSNSLDIPLHLPSGSQLDDWLVTANVAMPGWVLLPGSPSSASTLTLSVKGTVPYDAYPAPPVFAVTLAPASRPECARSAAVSLTVNNVLRVDPAGDQLPDGISDIAFQPALHRYLLLQPSTESVYMLDLSLGIAALSNPIALPGTGILGSTFAANDQHIYVVRDDNLYRLDANGELDPSDGPIAIVPRACFPSANRLMAAVSGWVLVGGFRDEPQLIADGSSGPDSSTAWPRVQGVASDGNTLGVLEFGGTQQLHAIVAGSLPGFGSNPSCPVVADQIAVSGGIIAWTYHDMSTSFHVSALSIGAPCGDALSFPVASNASGITILDGQILIGFDSPTSWQLALLDAATGSGIGQSVTLSNKNVAQLYWRSRGWAIATTYKSFADYNASRPVLIQL